ncbi:MAG: alcohol dehydrogenase catalytic domain-containing protein [Planctomycetes bacterium]|nr:alcohol dehydrogenase catalytic domain-containing protein [Planctomycetota bacterium]
MTDTVTALRLLGSEAIDPFDPKGPLTRNLAVERVRVGEPGPGEVLVEPLFVGVCGSDGSASLGKSNFSWVKRPRTIGHECSVRIVAFGPGAEGYGGLKAGDVVCPVPMRGCGDPRCRGCRNGRWNYCRRKQILGFHRDGALAQRMVLEVDRCVPLRAGLTALQGAVVEPLSVVAQGVLRKCTIRPGMDVVVTGCGIMGLIAAELCKSAGARVAVTGIERDREVRLKLAQERGFTPIVIGPGETLHEKLKAGVEALDGTRFGDDFEGGLVDALIECSGAPQALATAGLGVHLEGQICVIATYPSSVPFEATAFTRSGQVMSGVMGSSREDFETAMLLIERGAFAIEPYAQVYAFDRVLEAMDDSMAARTPKAIMAVNGRA